MKSPAEIAQGYAKIAQAKTTQKWYKLLILAVLAGAFIAFGAVAATTAGAYANNKPLVKGMVFPVGLMLVVVCGAELFTGNCLLISPLIGKDISVKGFFKNMGIVYVGNFLGGLLIAFLVVYSHAQSDVVVVECIKTAAIKSNMGFGDAVLRGILCNMLVCLAVWAATASGSAAGKILAVYLPILAFIVCGFEHSVANMYYLSAGLMANVEFPAIAAGLNEGLNVGNALLYCLLPSTLGNIVGGFLIGGAYHAVYRAKMPKAE